MPDNNEMLERQNAALTLQMLEWIAAAPHTYAEAIEVWRSSCPRHTIWEDALAAGLVDARGTSARVTLTSAGHAMLQRGHQSTGASTERPAA